MSVGTLVILHFLFSVNGALLNLGTPIKQQSSFLLQHTV